MRTFIARKNINCKFVKSKIQDDLKAAMKSGDKLRTMALRGVLSEMSRLEKDIRREPNDAEIIQIIKRERAKREETLVFARQAARQDLIEQNETEAKVLESYLPATTSPDEVRAEIQAAIEAGVAYSPERTRQRSPREEVAASDHCSLRSVLINC